MRVLSYLFLYLPYKSFFQSLSNQTTIILFCFPVVDSQFQFLPCASLRLPFTFEEKGVAGEGCINRRRGVLIREYSNLLF